MEDNFKTYKKYKFNHETETGGGDNEPASVTSALGLSDEFSDEVIKTMRKEEIDCDTFIECWENTFNKMLPNNAMEAFFIGWTARALYDMKAQNPMQMLMKMMGR